MPTAPEPITMTVDGQDFVLGERIDEPGVYDFRWLTGPDDYGFTAGKSDGSALSVSEAEWVIRDFLAQIDPATGNID